MSSSTGEFNPHTKVWSANAEGYKIPLDTFLGEKILEALDETPERILQINHDEETRLNCEDAKLLSIRVAQNLERLGIQSDDVVGFVCRNSGNLVPLIYGCVLIGAPVNPLHVSSSKETILQMFSQTKPKLVFCDFDVFELVREALNETKINAMIFTVMKKISVVPFVSELLTPTGSEFNFKPPKFDRPANEKLVAIVCASSETSGRPKGVCMPHTAVLQFINFKCKGIKKFVSLNFSSIHFGTGLIGLFLGPFRNGETRISTKQSFSPELCVKLIEQYQVTVVVISPVHLSALINSPFSKTGDFSSILVFSCTGGVVSECLRSKFKIAFPDKPLLISYGTSEMFIAAIPPGDKTDGLKVGRTYTNIQVKICDDEGTSLDIGEVGEVYAKPEFKFQGYYNNPESTENAVDSEGFIKTGDVGYLDQDGNIYILDRHNDIFKYKDHLVSEMNVILSKFFSSFLSFFRLRHRRLRASLSQLKALNLCLSLELLMRKQ